MSCSDQPLASFSANMVDVRAEVGSHMVDRLRAIRWVKPGLILAGVLLLAVGVVVAASGWRTEGLGPFVVGGLAFIALGVFEDRLTKVDFTAFGAGVSVALRDLAADAGPEVALEIARLGLADLVLTYSMVYGELRGHVDSRSRVQVQDAIIAAATRRTGSRRPDGRALQAALRAESSASRVIALGVALAHPKVVDPATVKVNITDSLSGNEQYHALLLLEAMWPHLASATKGELLNLVRDAPFIQDDPDRRRAAARLLELGAGP